MKKKVLKPKKDTLLNYIKQFYKEKPTNSFATFCKVKKNRILSLDGWQCPANSYMPNADFTHVLYMNYITINNCFLPGTICKNNFFRESELKNCYLAKSNFDNTTLMYTKFNGSDLNNVSFKEAMLNNTIFDYSTLIGADFTDVIVTNISCINAIAIDVKGIEKNMLSAAITTVEELYEKINKKGDKLEYPYIYRQALLYLSEKAGNSDEQEKHAKKASALLEKFGNAALTLEEKLTQLTQRKEIIDNYPQVFTSMMCFKYSKIKIPKPVGHYILQHLASTPVSSAQLKEYVKEGAALWQVRIKTNAKFDIFK